MKNAKNKVLVLLLLSLAGKIYAQEPRFEYEPYFSAIIVRNIDSSAKWYRSVFGLTTQNEINDVQHSPRVIILESPVFLLELLELKGSLIPNEILKGKGEATRIQGHFKSGFKVTDMDACLKRLESLKITVPAVYTDATSKKRNFLITDPDGNLLQFFE